MFVYLHKIVICMDSYYPVCLNLVTGEFLDISNQDNSFFDHNHDGFILIPKFDNQIFINKFLNTPFYRHKKNQVRQKMSVLTKGEGFNYLEYFIEQVTKVGLRNEWFAFWKESKIQTAQQWCEANNIPYTKKTPNRHSP